MTDTTTARTIESLAMEVAEKYSAMEPLLEALDAKVSAVYDTIRHFQSTNSYVSGRYVDFYHVSGVRVNPENIRDGLIVVELADWDYQPIGSFAFDTEELEEIESYLAADHKAAAKITAEQVAANKVAHKRALEAELAKLNDEGDTAIFDSVSDEQAEPFPFEKDLNPENESFPDIDTDLR